MEAAISVLATYGVAGLTPNAVDQKARLPNGTTVGMYPTQRDLIDAAANRLVFLDALDLTGFRASAEAVVEVVERGFAPENRDRFLARMELFLYSARNPDFVTMHWARDMFAAGAEAHMHVAKAHVPHEAAEAVLTIIEGQLLQALVSQRMSHDERLALTSRLLSGFFDKTNGRQR